MKQFFRVFFQRLFSKSGQAEIKAAYVELGQFLAAGAALYAGVRAKDFGAIQAQLPLFGVSMVALLGAVRSIVSSNAKAIANPLLPHIFPPPAPPALP